MQKKASVYNYHHSSQGHRQSSRVPQVRSCKGSYSRGGADRTNDPILTNTVFYAMHVILSLKLGDHEGLILLRPWLPSEEDLARCPACDPDADSYPCIPEFSSCLPGQSRTASCCLAAAGGMPAPGTQLRETQDRFCTFYFFSLIINIISIISVISKAVLISNL